jgi:DNA repair protein RecO (recombination protein O)
MIAKTDALVLRVAGFSSTSHVVTWLTPAHGKLATVVKGARRPKSLFLGQYDLFYTCELVFYTRDRNNLHIAKECAPVVTRHPLRTNWLAASYASYVCDIVSAVSPEGCPQQALYELTVSALDFLCVGTARPQFLLWFELRLLKTLGFAPQLSKCPACGKNSSLDSCGKRIFSHIRGGILCHKCSATSGNGGVTVAPDTAAMLKRWKNSDSPRVSQNTTCKEDQLSALTTLLGMFLNYHLDIMPASRAVAMEMTGIQRNLSRT